MRKLPLDAKKVISVIVAVGMIISLFSCMSGLSAFAIDNTPDPQSAISAIEEQAPAIVAETTEKGGTKSSDKAKNAETHTHCRCGAVNGVAGTGVATSAAHASHAYTTTYAPLSQADINAGTAIQKDGTSTNFTKGGLPLWNCWYLTEDVTVTAASPSGAYDYYFCFNGYTITYTGAGVFMTFKDASGAKSNNFCTCDPDKKGGVTVSGDGLKNEVNGGLFYIGQSNYVRTFCIFNGKYDLGSNAMTSSGGILYVGNGSSGTQVQNNVQLYDVEFIGSPKAKGTDGGLINIRGASKVTTYGGKYHDASVGNTKAEETHGALVSVWNSGIFTSWGGTFYGGSSNSTKAFQGGLFAARNSSTINLSSGTFTGSACANGGVVWAADTSTVNINGANAKLTGATVTSCGGAVAMTGSSTLNMTNGSIESGTAAYGGSIYLGGTSATATANISAGTISGGTAKNQGGGVHISSGCTLRFSGTAKITGCKSNPTSGQGGSISVPSGAKCYISGGTIEGGWATNWGKGGNIYANSPTAFEMSGGVVKGGYTAVGGNIYLEGSTNFKFSGGEIKDGYNDTTRTNASEGGLGGNMYITAGATLTMSGTAKISGGKVTATKGYAYSYGGNIYNLGTVNISGGTVEGGTSSSNGGSIWSSGPINVSEADETYPTTITGGKAGAYGGNVYTTGTFTMTGGSVLNGESQSQSNDGAGNLYLLGANNVISGGLVDGGFTVTWGRGGNIHLGAQSLEISGTAVISNGQGGEGGNIYTDAGSTLTIKGSAQVLDGKNWPSRGSDCHGGNIYNQGALTVSESAVISGGTLSTTTDKGLQGGNIYSTASGSLTVAGGTVKDGSAKLGGNIFVIGQFRMTDGTVDNGYASSAGGGNIFVTTKDAIISGGTIQNGKVLNWADGGNIYVDSDAELTINGADTLIDNGFAGRGGNIYVGTNGSVLMNNGTIQNGHSDTTRLAESKGGNVFVGSKASFTMKDGTIKDGVVYGRGGNVAIENDAASSFTQDGGTISGGKCYDYYSKADTYATSAYGGGNIYAGGTYTLNAGTVTGGQFLATNASNKGSGGNISAGDTNSHVFIHGGLIEKGVSASDDQTGNLSFWYLAPVDCFVMDGGIIRKGEDIEDLAEGLKQGGTRLLFSSNIEKVADISGDAEITDIFTVQVGCVLKLTNFSGSLNSLTTNGKTGVVGKLWDADYFDLGQVTTYTQYYTPYYNEGTLALLFYTETNAIETAQEITSVEDVHLSNSNAIVNAENANELTKEYYGYTSDGDVLAEAQEYKKMTKVSVATATNFNNEEKVLYVFYSAMDLEDFGLYDFARIVITINNVTKGNEADIEDAYESVLYNGSEIATKDSFNDGDCTKSQYVYFTTVSLANANAIRDDVTYSVYAEVHLKDGKVVKGETKTGTLKSICPAEILPE